MTSMRPVLYFEGSLFILSKYFHDFLRVRLFFLVHHSLRGGRSKTGEAKGKDRLLCLALYLQFPSASGRELMIGCKHSCCQSNLNYALICNMIQLTTLYVSFVYIFAKYINSLNIGITFYKQHPMFLYESLILFLTPGLRSGEETVVGNWRFVIVSCFAKCNVFISRVITDNNSLAFRILRPHALQTRSDSSELLMSSTPK